MTDTQIVERNRAIFDFMGCKHSEHEDIDKYEMQYLKYHSSWDWLMPVGKKIYDLLAGELKKRPPHTASEGDLIEVDIHCAIREYNIVKAHEHIYRFVCWYNTQNKQQ